MENPIKLFREAWNKGRALMIILVLYIIYGLVDYFFRPTFLSDTLAVSGGIFLACLAFVWKIILPVAGIIYFLFLVKEIITDMIAEAIKRSKR